MKLLIVTLTFLASFNIMAQGCYYFGSFACRASEAKYGTQYATEMIHMDFRITTTTACENSNQRDGQIRVDIMQFFKDEGIIDEECSYQHDLEYYKSFLKLSHFDISRNIDRDLATILEGNHKRCVEVTMVNNPKLQNCLKKEFTTDL